MDGDIFSEDIVVSNANRLMSLCDARMLWRSANRDKRANLVAFPDLCFSINNGVMLDVIILAQPHTRTDYAGISNRTAPPNPDICTNDGLMTNARILFKRRTFVKNCM